MHIYTCTYTHIYLHTHTHTHAQIFINIYTYTYTGTLREHMLVVSAISVINKIILYLGEMIKSSMFQLKIIFRNRIKTYYFIITVSLILH
jgi:hypothetical protein